MKYEPFSPPWRATSGTVAAGGGPDKGRRGLPGHDARAIANYLMIRAREHGAALTPMQLIKLVYLCHGWMLGLYGRPLIDEPVEAWQYGPVIRDLYEAVRDFRGAPVKDLLPVPPGGTDYDAEERSVMDQVFDLYGRYSGIALSRLTHAPGTPWDETWQRFGRNAEISTDLIQEHFRQLTRDRAA